MAKMVDAQSAQIAQDVLWKLNTAEMQFQKHIVRDPNKSAHLEDLLTHLELHGHIQGMLNTVGPWTEQDHAKITRTISEAFLIRQYELNVAAWSSNPYGLQPTNDLETFRKTSETWSKFFKRDDIVITFNWDLLCDVVLWRSGLWSYSDGYGFSCGSQGSQEAPSQISILKLHGSVNWVQEHEEEPVTKIAHARDFFWGSKDFEGKPNYSEAQLDSGRKLVLPSYLKDVSSNEALLDVWTKAQDALRSASQLIVVGYSLNKADAAARLLFGIELARNKNLSSVTLVAPQVGEWGPFVSQRKKQLIHRPLKFEDWLKTQ